MTDDNTLTEGDISEYQTRKKLIDRDLRESGWIENRDWINEYELSGMPNESNVGFADYVLFDDRGYPLAVIEAKRTTKSPEIGRHQAELYADLLERKFHRRPVIFLTNGYDKRIIDCSGNEREIWGIYCKRDLEKYFNLKNNRRKLSLNININENITDRYYQKSAIKAVCSAFDKGYRKALLVMATGSGKTRTIVSLVDVLLSHGWIRNILFLADRTSLVHQAAQAFTNNLPALSSSNLCKNNPDVHARCIISTYQTMINLVDKSKEKDGTRTFSNGHFDLIIVDEAHRSIYNRYRSIFEYFDGLLVGLTATPKSDVDKNTYELFGQECGSPTYGYELAQAVKDGYLVDYKSVEIQTKFLDRGVVYADLTKDEQNEYENLFLDGEYVPEKIESSEINEWLFNYDTSVRVLDALMRMGLKINDGSSLGKTIIFARNHTHAEFIYKVFNEQFPDHHGECQVIDNYYQYSDDMIVKFKNPDSKVRIAISVDMMDTGIDIPDILNLVFFKPVYSKSKFWQMIGRGTRLCPGLIDGNDKTCFYIFDFCSNFEFFRINPKGITVKDTVSIQSRIFSMKVLMAYRLQELQFQEEPFISFRKQLVDDIKTKLNELVRDNFAVKAHLNALDYYSRSDVLNALNDDDVLRIEQELAPLIQPYHDDPGAIRMDALILAIEYGYITNSPRPPLFQRLRKYAKILSKKMTIPDVAAKIETIRMVLKERFLERADLVIYEKIGRDLRDIMKYIEKPTGPGNKPAKTSNFIDEVLKIEINDSELVDEQLSSYREKAEYFVRSHQDDPSIIKLKTNQPLNDDDLKRLEKILWSDIGTFEDYKREFENKPLGQFIREIIGLDMGAAKQAFSKYIDETTLDDRQVQFINQLVEYVVHNGVISDMQILTESPFKDTGNVSNLFQDQMKWKCILTAINDINRNAGMGL